MCITSKIVGVANLSAAQRLPNDKEQYIDSKPNANLIKHIWLHESTKGTNQTPKALHNICKNQGKSNELGYGGMRLKICFETFEKSVDRVSRWLDERKELTDNQKLCYYNKGLVLEQCDYLN